VADDTAIKAEPGSRTIVVTRIIDAPRTRVFEAWTQPEHVRGWWDPAGAPLAECAIDLRPGGAFRFVNDRPSRQECFAGVYRELLPPERIVFESNGAIGTIVFNAVSERTQLVLTIECASETERDQYLRMGIAVGTARSLANLGNYLGATDAIA
jgi:uncharacterized protein YndB with AHSA1/START domain